MAEIARTANITGTQGVALLVKEAPEDALRVCQIVGTARIAETPGEALLVNEVVSGSSRETQTAERDSLVKEAAQTDPELEQLKI